MLEIFTHYKDRDKKEDWKDRALFILLFLIIIGIPFFLFALFFGISTAWKIFATIVFLLLANGFYFWIFYEGIKDRNPEESKWEAPEEFEEWGENIENTKMTVQKPKKCCDAHGTRGVPFLFLTNSEFSAQTLRDIECLIKDSDYFVITNENDVPPSRRGFVIEVKSRNEAKIIFRALYDALHTPTFISIDPVDILKSFRKTKTKFFRAEFKDFESDKISDITIENKPFFLVVYKRDAAMKDMLNVLDSIKKEKSPSLFTIFEKKTISKGITRVVYFYCS